MINFEHATREWAQSRQEVYQLDHILNYTIENGIKHTARIFLFFFGGKQSLSYSHPPFQIPNIYTHRNQTYIKSRKRKS